jgi:hypothetical protein
MFKKISLVLIAPVRCNYDVCQDAKKDGRNGKKLRWMPLRLKQENYYKIYGL